MNTKREIFNMFAEREIYLTSYKLDSIKERLEKSPFDIYQVELEIEKEADKYSDPNVGAYVVENKHKKFTDCIGKSVQQYDKDGVLVAEYKSLYEANKKTGYGVGNISNACNGKAKSVKGYKWKFAS